MKPSFFIRAFWCFIPLAVAFLLPPALALWVESHRFTLPLAESVHAVVEDYSRTLGDSLWVTTFYQLPPFLLLSAGIAFVACRCSQARLAALCLSGLALIVFVQIRFTIDILKDIPNGEAEFVEVRYVLVSLVSVLALGLPLFFIPPLGLREPENA